LIDQPGQLVEDVFLRGAEIASIEVAPVAALEFVVVVVVPPVHQMIPVLDAPGAVPEWERRGGVPVSAKMMPRAAGVETIGGGRQIETWRPL
jgi:hypothetical protein